MTRMTLRRDDVVAGVDTHKDEHAVVLLDGLGGRLTELVVPATTDGFAHLLAVATGHVGPQGRLIAFGVEGTGSYGIGLARFLRRQGYQVREAALSWPPRRPPTAASSRCGCSRSPGTPPSRPAPPP